VSLYLAFSRRLASLEPIIFVVEPLKCQLGCFDLIATLGAGELLEASRRPTPSRAKACSCRYIRNKSPRWSLSCSLASWSGLVSGCLSGFRGGLSA